MEDINLDNFLSSTTRHVHQLERVPTPIPANGMDNVFGFKNPRKNKLEMAKKIAKVDELIKEIEKIKQENNELKNQLKDFQKTAQKVQNLYIEEKLKREIVQKDLMHLREQYDKVDIDLANKNMVYDQMNARLAEYESRPIDYNSLIMKYVKIMQTLIKEDCLRYSQDKSLLEDLKQYCLQMNLKININQSPKKSKSKAIKLKTVDASVQCSELGGNYSTNKPDVQEQYTKSGGTSCDQKSVLNGIPDIPKPESKEQLTQCEITRCDQASQYISTMITRQTNTEKVIQKHVSTMFPEPKPTPPVNDILNVFCKWAEIKSITPLGDSPARKTSGICLKNLNTTGTCTMLCNIRRKIDYLPATTPGIKQELTTPSPSPIPTSNIAASVASNAPRLRTNNVPTSTAPTNMNNQNLLPHTILNIFNATSSSALGQLSTTAFNELWQILGTMLLSLLQTSNAGIANTNQNSINQQQFLDWLLELYVSSQLSSNTRTQTVAQQDNLTQTSPLLFNESTVLPSTNIIRPRAKKSFAERVQSSQETGIASQSQSFAHNNLQTIHQQNVSTSTDPNITVENFSQDYNSMDMEIQQIQAATNTVENQTVMYETNRNQLSLTNGNQSTETLKDNNKHNILAQIQELLPKSKLNKNSRKALKRLLKNKEQKKEKKSAKRKEAKVYIINDTDDNHHIETAVDFLKKFAQEQVIFGNNEMVLEQSVPEKNKTSTQNCSTENLKNPATHVESIIHTDNLQHFSKPLTTASYDDFAFIKPAVSPAQGFQHKTKCLGEPSKSTFVKPAAKLKKSKISEKIGKKYQMLFGDSDTEIDDQEEIPKINKNLMISPICADDFINSNENALPETSEKFKCSLDIIGENCHKKEITSSNNQQICPQQIFTVNSNPISNNFTVNNRLDQTCQQMNNDFIISNQEQFSIPEISTPLLETLENTSLFRSPVNASQYSNCNALVFNQIDEHCQNIVDNKIEQPKIDAYISVVDIPSDINKDLAISVDEEIVKVDNQNHMLNELLKPTETDITEATVDFESDIDIEKDLELSSDEEFIKEDNQNHMLNELGPYNNKFKEHHESINNDTYHLSSLPDLQDTKREYKNDTKTSLIESNNYNNTVFCSRIRSPQDIKHTDANNIPSSSTAIKDNFRQNGEENSNISSETKTTENLQNIKTDKHTNCESCTAIENSTSDFEKDFELSSDNESELTENDDQFKSELNPIINENHIMKSNSLSGNVKEIHALAESEEKRIQYLTINLSDKSRIALNNNNQFENEFNPIINETYNKDMNQDISLYSVKESEKNTISRCQDTKINSRCVKKFQNSSLTESEEISNLEISQHMEDDLNGFEQLKNVQQSQIIDNNISHKSCLDNDIKLYHGPHTSRPLPDFSNTFSQHRKLLNSEKINSPHVEPCLNNVDQLKDIDNDANDKIESATNSLCWPTITVHSTTTTSNDRFTSTSEDEEISIIEISSDNTNQRDLSTPIESDLIIDEDFNEEPSEADVIKNEQPKENLDHSEQISTKGNEKTEIENDLIIEEDHNYFKSTTKQLKTESLSDTKKYLEETMDATLNSSSTISTLLNSTLYKEVLTDSINPIFNDLLKEDHILKSPPQDIKPKRGRKRKSESIPEVVQPFTRSQRLKAQRNILQQSLTLSEVSIEIGKYTPSRKNSTKDVKSTAAGQTKKKNLNLMKTNTDLKTTNFAASVEMSPKVELKNNLPIIPMGFFRERFDEVDFDKEIAPNTIAKTIEKTNESCLKNCSEHDFKTIKGNTLHLEYDDIFMDSNNKSFEITSSQSSIDNLNNNGDINRILNVAFCHYSESPKSPPPVDNNEDNFHKTIIIPHERLPQYMPQHKDATLFDTLIKSYTTDSQKNIQSKPPAKVLNRQQTIVFELQSVIKQYCYNDMKLDPDHTALKLVHKLLNITEDYNLIQKALLNIAQNAESLNVPEKELPSIIQEMPPRHLGICLQRLYLVLKHFLNKNANFCQELILKIESLLFSTQHVDRLSLQGTLNITQLYLLACKQLTTRQQQESLEFEKLPARIFIAKCLYYYNKKAILMIHEVLLWYPTVLPHREDCTYDRSDALITVIQEILMNTRYDMDNQELRGKSLISKLRYEYHYDPFKPSLDEVIINLVEKIKNSKFYNISMAFGVLCKRLPPAKVQEKFLQLHLLPLAKEYFSQAVLTTEYDKRISVLLCIISVIVKPFPVDTNVDVYLNEFSRFLNGFDRPVIQEAALSSILRLQRFGYVNCYKLLRHFKPTFDLDTHTQAALKTFLHRKPLKFWKTIKSQNPIN